MTEPVGRRSAVDRNWANRVFSTLLLVQTAYSKHLCTYCISGSARKQRELASFSPVCRAVDRGPESLSERDAASKRGDSSNSSAEGFSSEDLPFPLPASEEEAEAQLRRELRKSAKMDPQGRKTVEVRGRAGTENKERQQRDFI